MQQRETGRRRGHLFTVAVLLATGAHAGPVDSLQPGQWYEFPNSRLRTVVPSPAPEGSVAAITDYSGGTFDTSRNRLIVWGGGHAAYAGNEIYAFSVATGQWSRLTNPSSSPTAVHSYDQLEYLPNQDTFFAPGGSVWGSGAAVQTTWLFNFANNAWSNGGQMPGSVYDFWYYNMTSDYDPLSGRAVVIGLERSGTYDGGTRSWALTGEGHGYVLGLSGALDTQRRQFVEVGRGSAFIYNVASNGGPGTRSTLTTTGPQTIVACDGPGFVFDPVSDRYVGWCGGSSVYSLNPATRVWTQHSASNAVNPGNPYSGSSYKGTFGRFEYMPAYNAFIVMHNIDEDVFAYRLTSGTGSLPQTPSVSLSATPTTVASGGSTALSWSSANVTACTASGAWSGSRPTSGQQTLSNLTSSGTFTLSCTGSNGAAANSVALTVQPAGGGGGSGGGATGGGATGGGTGGGTVEANADWASRSAAPGVVRALGFDTQAQWLDYVWDNSGCYADYAPGCRRNAFDPNVKASGAGSVRFDLKSQSGEGAAGNLAINFSDDLQTQFGPNEEFWVQWRQRFDPYAISHDYRETSGSGAWKQIIMGQGDRRTASGSIIVANSCVETDLVVGNVGSRGVPNSYNECGRYSPFEQFMGNVYTRQNQRLDASGNTTCQHYPTGGNTTGCLKYVGNEWMTFMIHLQLGPQGSARSSSSDTTQPGLINSTYEFYVARQGQPFQLAHRQEDLVIPRGQYWVASRGVNPDLDGDPGYSSGWGPNDGHPQAEIGKIWLTPYYTAKDASEVHENASIWYDELIVSTQPIAAPGGAAPAPAPATPSVTLTANPASITSGSSTTLYWSTENVSSCTASGAWSGARATSGEQDVGPLTATATYTLTCGTVSRSATVTVQSSGGGSGGGGGGTTNQAPAKPVLAGLDGPLSPGDAVIEIASTYLDPDGDPFASAEWEIASDQNFDSLALARIVEDRTSLSIAAGVLEPMQSYWMRTRHRDDRGAASAWSTTVAFTTAATMPGDADGNGIEDSSQVYGFADSNGNGTDDSDEGICNLSDAESNSVVGLESDAGNLACFRSVGMEETPALPSDTMDLPYGMFSFRIEGLRVDEVNPASVTVSVYLPERPEGSVKWYKLDPATGSLFEFAGQVTFDGNTALVELVDGGAGDFDGVVNGVIVDPSGPVTIAASGGNNGGGSSGSSGGSSMGVLLPALMAAAGLRRRRRGNRRCLRH